MNSILSFMGLALRGRRLAVGEEPVVLAARTGEARLILLASDAAENTLRRGARLAEEGRCLFLTLPFTKAELGGALGRGSAAIAAVTDTGFAAALARKLAAMDPERYGDTAARMERKLQRAKERREAPPREKEKKKRPAGEAGRARSGRPPRSGGWDRPENRRPGGKTGGRPSGGGDARRSRPSKESRAYGQGARRPGGEKRTGGKAGGRPNGPPRSQREGGPRPGGKGRGSGSGGGGGR